MNESQLGKYFTDSDGNIWQMETFIESPSVTFKKVGTDETIRGGVGARIFDDFVEVAKEQDNIIRKLFKQIYLNDTNDVNENMNEIEDEPGPCLHEILIEHKCAECGMEFVPQKVEPKHPYGRRRF